MSACGTVRRHDYTPPLRYYDAPHSDYHYWTRDEYVPYGRWEAEQHREHMEYRKLNEQDRAAYWEWRHSHR